MRVRDRGDGRIGVVLSATESEIRWQPDTPDNPFMTSVFSSSPDMLERIR